MGQVTMADGSGGATTSAYCDVWQFRDGRMAALTAYVVELERP